MVLLLKLSLYLSLYTSAVYMTVEVEEVYFTSLNFYTVLHWKAVCDVQPTCSYEVQYKVYGDEEWTNKTDCGEARNACNMTAEILMEEHVQEKLFARVSATTENITSKWKMSKKFEPLRHTNISAPLVSLTVSSHSIQAHITAPQLIYHIKYPDNKEQQETSFNINITTMSKLLYTEITKENVWNITDLVPGNYCISVNMKFGEITSSRSPKQCVQLKDLTVKKVIIGSILAAFGSLAIVVILTIHLSLYRHFNPKTRLPSNLILHHLKSKASADKPVESFITTSIFDGMEFCKYIPESKEQNVKECPQIKRYISTEAWGKDYVNCRQKDIDQSVLEKMVELRNSTYGTNPSEKYFLLECPNVWMSSQARYSKKHTGLHHTHLSNEDEYYKSSTACEENCKKTGPLYVNQDEELDPFYINV